jgi:phasin family protein
MVQMNDQLVALNRAHLETALKFAEIGSEGLEKLVDLQFRTAKSAFADSLKTAKQLGAIKDATELSTFGGSLSQPAWEKAQAYARSVYEVASATQAQMTSLLEQQLGELNRNVEGVLEGVLKNAPAGSDGAVAAVKSIVQSASAVCESMLKVAKQMAVMAEANAATAAATVVAPRKKTA